VSNKPSDIVTRGTGRNITFDNWYTSNHLAKSLLQKETICIGTLKKDNREFPTEFQANKTREVGSYHFAISERYNTDIIHIKEKQDCAIAIYNASFSNY
jgi:hypothetical protein